MLTEVCLVILLSGDFTAFTNIYYFRDQQFYDIIAKFRIKCKLADQL